jgi:hypothetical protein
MMADDEKEVEDATPPPQQTEDREAELKDKPGVEKHCLELYKDIEKGFQDQWERGNAQMDYWDIYNCNLGPNQFYSGNSKIFVPIVHDAVNARKTRFVNQIFPQSGKHIEVSASEDKPQAIMSLLEFYIRKCRLRTSVMPGLVRNGDVEGQYNLVVGWTRNERHVAMRVKKGPTVDALKIEGEEEFDDIEEEALVHQYPLVEVVPDADVLVLPFTAASIEAAVQNGGSVTVIRRWSKSKIRQLIREKEIDKEAGQALIEAMAQKGREQAINKDKKMVDAAGIKSEGGKTSAQIYETWAKVNVEGEGERRLCRIYFGGEDNILSVRRNPYWCDKVPVLSAPVEKVQGSFKGMSKIKFVDTMQYAANDAVNMGWDAAAYALLPIIMTDPEKNPRTGSMILNVAAIWETSPKDTQFANFPPLWKDAFGLVNASKEQIFQTLGVNPAMMPQQVQAPGKKMNQAQIANEQQVDLLTTADAVTTIEGEILTPLLQWFIWLDHQYRDTDITLRAFGEMGIRAEMEKIEPVQMDRRFEFRWFGVEAVRNAQQLQMQMAGMNMINGIPPQKYPGYELNMAPVISQFVENLFGPRLAPQIFTDIRKKLTLDPQFENTMLEAGYPLLVHPMDEDQAHMQAHMQAFQEQGDMHGTIREHMIRHQMQMQQKQQAMQMQQQQMMAGGEQQQKGQGGKPRQGAVPGGPRPNGQQPPGAVHQDRMHVGAPRAARG